MRNLIIAALVAMPALAGVATAEETRMNQVEFVRAARCLAYVGAPALQADRPDMTALSAKFTAEKAVKSERALNYAKAAVHDANTAVRQADTPAEVDRLRASRDRACSDFSAAAHVAQN